MLKKLIKFIVIIFVLLIGFTTLQVIRYKYINPENTNFMKIREKQAKAAKRRYKKIYKWVPLTNISYNLRRTVIRAEDAKFYEHNGFDFEAIKNAIKKNQKKKKIKYGASTITQQLAKNLFLWPERSYLRKALEAYYTILIEIFLSKDRILELYLNVIEWGDGIYGAEAASQYYFKTTSKKLTLEQSALLTAIIPNPRKYKINSNYVNERKEKLLNNI
ncbi:MAG TPA: monofunctional biosynthetic peptidoglycan transglycosylase [bacterium]|nr:monofunctional biosynthetic peptidoglycan transglycosylase [bacterium]HOL46771.1 monofunctional biosynthetic peptidoglycan transglycosylase [bacterium]HPQ17726.1 monofunctional biosynthetic peptidoglycan transglycosylase [bacterium]